MQEQFEWSESGKLLLRQIQSEINKHGGNIKCASSIEGEWTKIYRPKFKRHFNGRQSTGWSEEQIKYLIKNHEIMAHRSIALYLDRTESAIHKKVESLRLRGLIEKASILRSKLKGHRKEFVATDGNNMFRTIKDAAKSIGMPRTTLNGMLLGKRYNKTNIRLL